MKKNILISSIILILSLLNINNIYAYDFCNDTSINKYVNSSYKLKNEKYLNWFLVDFINSNLNNSAFKVDKRLVDDFHKLTNDYFDKIDKKLKFTKIEEPLNKRLTYDWTTDVQWIWENLYNYWFVFLNDNKYTIEYVWKELSKEIKDQNFKTLENYINSKKIDCNNATNTNTTPANNTLPTANSWVWNELTVPPWTFSGWYSFLDESFINLIKANLVVSESIMEFETNMKNKNMPSFEEEYYGVLEMIKKDTTLNEKQKQDYINELSTAWVKLFVSNILPALSLMEHWWNTKLNPWNNQWVFQLVYIEAMFKNNNFQRNYYTPQNRIKDVYKKHTELTKEQFRYQLADILLFAARTQWWVDKWLKRNLKDTDTFSYYKQLDQVFIALNWELKLSWPDKEKIIRAIINKDDKTLIDFLNKYSNVLRQYNIIVPEDMYSWLDQIFVATVWTFYNGAWNNWTWRKFWSVKNVFDNNYVSNSPKWEICFWTIWKDFWKNFTNLKKTEWLISYYIQYNHPDKINEKMITFISLIKKMNQAKLLYAFHWPCNK